VEQIITVNEGLWLVLEVVAPEHNDGLIKVRDDVGGEVLIDKAEIPALIEALKKLIL